MFGLFIVEEIQLVIISYCRRKKVKVIILSSRALDEWVDAQSCHVFRDL
jgi:hypothetical protein